MKAMILAAGFGVRLKPITDIIPKPLIKIKDKPVIEYVLEQVKNAGIHDVIINLHHLGDMIKFTLGNGERFGLSLHYSYEPEIKGTAGALLWAKKFLDEPFFLINGDILFNVALSILPQILNNKHADAVMVVHPADETEHKISNVFIDKQGYVKSLFKPYPETRSYVFTGIQLLKPDALNYIPENVKQPSTTTHMYPEMLKHGSLIACYIHDGLWIDIGDTKRLGYARNVIK